MSSATDRPVAALLTDLKRRGLLEDTLVIWGGEFGRTPVSQKGSRGRDHNATGFSMWFAGGGVKPGTIYGSTDEIGLHAVENDSYQRRHVPFPFMTGSSLKLTGFLLGATNDSRMSVQ